MPRKSAETEKKYGNMIYRRKRGETLRKRVDYLRETLQCHTWIPLETLRKGDPPQPKPDDQIRCAPEEPHASHPIETARPSRLKYID